MVPQRDVLKKIFYIDFQLPFDNWFGPFPNHLITGLDIPQIFIPTTQGGQIWAVLMDLLTELNYMEEILFVLAQFSLGITFKIFIEIFYFIS